MMKIKIVLVNFLFTIITCIHCFSSRQSRYLIRANKLYQSENDEQWGRTYS